MRSPLAVVALPALAAIAALVIACQDPGAVGLPCESADNCPGGLVCSAGACAARLGSAVDDGAADPSAIDPDVLDPGPNDPVPFPINPNDPGRALPPPSTGGPNEPPDPPDGGGPTPGEPGEPGEPAPPGWTIVTYDAPLFGTPRIVNGSEIYFLVGPCTGLARAFSDGSVDLVASLRAGEGCLAELDVAASGAVVHVVARRTWQAESAVLLVDVAAAGLLPGSVGFSPLGDGEHRGVRPHVALTQGGEPRWLWSVRQTYGADLIEQALVTTTSPAVVANVEGLVDDLAYVVDANDNDAIFLTDLTNDRLILRTQGITRFLELGVSGAIDAVACGSALHVVYRLGDELRITSVEGTLIEDTIIDSGLSTGRVRGDVAIACDDGELWSAYTLVSEGVVRLAGPLSSASQAFAIEEVAAAKGGVSLAVIAGAPQIAFGSPGGMLRSATRPP